jgi:NAD(P)-dependent dehydrogenase (short-subunit alcohol dehydrogenase family)
MGGVGGMEGRVTVVTGATAGIGRACSCALARAGASLVLVGRSADRLEEAGSCLAASSGLRPALSIKADVRDPEGMERMARTTLDRFGRIDVLIASAGILRPSESRTLKMLHQTSPSEWDEVLDTNLRGVFLADRAVLPAMIEQRRGQIINVSSTSGRRGYAFDAAYCASKFAVIGLTQALAEEVKGFGVKVEALLPGAIDTAMWEQNGPFQRPEHASSPESVARAVIEMLQLEEDAWSLSPSIEPFRKPELSGWRRA